MMVIISTSSHQEVVDNGYVKGEKKMKRIYLILMFVIIISSIFANQPEEESKGYPYLEQPIKTGKGIAPENIEDIDSPKHINIPPRLDKDRLLKNSKSVKPNEQIDRNKIMPKKLIFSELPDDYPKELDELFEFFFDTVMFVSDFDLFFLQVHSETGF